MKFLFYIKKYTKYVLPILCCLGICICIYNQQEEKEIIYANFAKITKSYESQLDLESAYALMDENLIIEKIKPFFHDGLAGQERLFYDLCKELDVPFDLALAISLHETGNGTSQLAVYSHNYGGLRGSVDWLSFSTAEEGVTYYINTLYKGYVSRGARTPETIQPAYCPGSTTWVSIIYSYMYQINRVLAS